MDDTMYLPLDEEEQEILDFIEKGEWESIPNMEQEIQRLEQAARAYFENKREYPVLITHDELVEAREILGAQLLGGGYLPQTAQTIKSLLDKIEAALQNNSLAS